MFSFWFKNLSSRQQRGFGLILVGLVCFITAFLVKGYQYYKQPLPSFSKPPQPLKQEVDEKDFPAKILIPKVGINLPVSLAKASDDVWEISNNEASYLVGSGIPGKEGNVIIYGHNKNNLLGPIRWLSNGAEISVVNQKGEEFIYQVVETKTVSPQTIEVISPTKDASLTLYTCSGSFDKQRFVIVAKLQPK